MMGTTHAASGAAAWLAATPALAAVYTPGQVIAGAFLCAGAAMLPDLDQGGIKVRRKLGVIPWPKSWGATVARTYGWPTAGLAYLIGKVAGGHRKGTHSVFGIAAFTVLAGLAVAFPGPWDELYVWLLFGVAARAANLALPGHPSMSAFVYIPVMTWVTVATYHVVPNLPTVLPLAVFAGCVMHIAGDGCTTGRVPILYPVDRTLYGPGWFATGAWQEKWLVLPFLVVASVTLFAVQ